MKKLIPNTIIPEHLYVERIADQQLRDIIHDMGRPGYILVARQMGKTNLLINAKKKLENSEDVFVYIDLSNRYDTDRECFRSIIDTILETNQLQLESTIEEIYSERNSINVTPHREHSRELRKILRKINGKLIVILDEIDSLTSADYSDKIFAHVRSIYFERISFKEYERLSYIISGVAEPSEIIKDKSISPFNIGQKILLGDFSYTEFESFIKKAELNFDENIVKRIFYWCNGNPRLSWDICSFLEDILLQNREIVEIDVDETVKSLYLTKFDRPPVDHIRALVESDKELREAVIAIIYEKTDYLSDKVKNRLYLSGVLGSDYEIGKIKIKNKIIEASLDENWLSDLEKASNLSKSKAEELYFKGKYNDALEIYKHLSKQQELDRAELMSINYKLGLCYFRTGKYRQAIETYQDSIYDKNGFRDLYMDQMYTLAMSHFKLNEDVEALDKFNEIIEDKTNLSYFEALLSKSAILVRIGGDEEKCNAIELNESIIEQHNNGVHVTEQVLSAAYYNVAILNESTNKSFSVECYLKSSEIANDINKITPLISAISLEPQIINDHLDTILYSLKSGRIRLDVEKFETGVELTSAKITLLTNILFDNGRLDEIENILDLIKENCLEDKSNFSRILVEMAVPKIPAQNVNEIVYFFKKATDCSKEYSTPELTFTCNKFLSFFEQNNSRAQELYLKGFQNYVDVSDSLDIHIFEKVIFGCIEQKDYQKAIGYCDLIIDNEGLNSISNKLKFFIIIYLKMISSQSENEKIELARMIMEIVNYIEESDTSLPRIDKGNIEVIKNVAEQTIGRQLIQTFVRLEKKYGRNEKIKVRHENGREEWVKYKSVSDLISKGSCKIIN